jgi:hypothetical protein
MMRQEGKRCKTESCTYAAPLAWWIGWFSEVSGTKSQEQIRDARVPERDARVPTA